MGKRKSTGRHEAMDASSSSCTKELAIVGRTKGSFLLDSAPAEKSIRPELLDLYDDWYASDIFKLVSQNGPTAPPGNQRVAVPLWVLHYFDDCTLALVFGQILYWFGISSKGIPRARRRERSGVFVIDKTHRALADELGIRNPRRIEKALGKFRTLGLIGYRVTGIGKGRTTRIWLCSEGVRIAYESGCDRLDEVEERQGDRNGGC